MDRPLQRIREFRNRPEPGIVVTVDLLSTGVDIPDLEFIVFLRPVKIRILFEQMLGRGTRKGEKYPDKTHFTVFDCFDGTLLEYFRDATAITADRRAAPRGPSTRSSRTSGRTGTGDYNIRCLVKRLQRIDKEMAGEARRVFAAYVPDGDLGRFARDLPRALQRGFVGTMKLLRDAAFQDLLRLPAPRAHLRPGHRERGHGVVGADAARQRRQGLQARGLPGRLRPLRPRERGQIEAIRILLDRPRDWSTEALTELRQKLAATRERFTVENLQKAHEIRYHKALVDIISMVKHAAREEPAADPAERVDRAFPKSRRARPSPPSSRLARPHPQHLMQANL